MKLFQSYPATLFLAVLFSMSLAETVRAQTVLPESEERVLHYDSTADLADPVTLLQKQLAQGKTKLQFETNRGYLPSLLKALRIPVSSQTLVFSKSSSQRAHTSPQTPRAIYFSDDASVGWAQGAADIDIASIDPKLGSIFYTLSQNPERPTFIRRTDCMQCHLGPKTVNVPGWIVRSFYTASSGTPLAAVTEFVSGHNAPLRSRWGGWYVDGSSQDPHLGNLLFTDPNHTSPGHSTQAEKEVDLRNYFNTSPYLSPHSDIVALLVLEHQIRMQNLITHAQYETRLALSAESGAAGESSAQERIARAGEMLLEYMLFRNEALLKGPVRPSSNFAPEFQAAGLRDCKGRSLRDLDLKTRLFRYPCSFLIYSESFDALPAEMKDYLWRRLDQILTAKADSPGYAGVNASDRQSVFEILRDTKPEFAAWLRAQAKFAAAEF